jgi:hypothetical protein
MTPAPLTHSRRNGSGKKPSKYPIQSYHQQMNTCLIALMHELQWDIVDKKKHETMIVLSATTASRQVASPQGKKYLQHGCKSTIFFKSDSLPNPYFSYFKIS